MKIILFLKLFVLVGQFYQKGKIDLNFNYSVIVHTKQFLSLFSYIREITCLFALLQFCVKESEKKLLQLNWSCWSALTSFTHVFRSRCSKSQCFTVSVPNYAEGCSSVATQNELNHFCFVNCYQLKLSSFYSPV